MRKKFIRILIYLIFIIILVKSFQIVFLPKTTPVSVEEDLPERFLYKEFNYGDYKTVKLLHTETGEVEELPLDIYLYGVVSGEMPANFEFEALKAQAIVARTYTIYQMMTNTKHKDVNADICDSPLCCQAWITKENRMARWSKNERESNWLKIENAVNSTIGKVILYEGQPIRAYFHSNSGGMTETSLNVWGGDLHYLQAVETSGEEAYTSYESQVKISKDELIVKMKDNFADFEIDYNQEDWIKILENTDTSRKSKSNKNWKQNNNRKSGKNDFWFKVH